MKTVTMSGKEHRYYVVLDGQPMELGGYSRALRGLTKLVDKHEVELIIVPTNAMFRRFTRAEEPGTQDYVDNLLNTLKAKGAQFMIQPPGALGSDNPYCRSRELQSLKLPKLKKKVNKDDYRLHVFTDGSCLGNPGFGGWGWASKFGTGYGGELQVTNNMMELQAVIEALTANPKGSVLIITDSRYVVNNVERLAQWRRQGYEGIANADRWKKLHRLLALRDVKFQWVKGHSASKGNIKADALARKGAEEMRDTA